jgi:hypothetical protein
MNLYWLSFHFKPIPSSNFVPSVTPNKYSKFPKDDIKALEISIQTTKLEIKSNLQNNTNPFINAEDAMAKAEASRIVS